MTLPYTYLIKFKPTNQVYYGSRTAKHCHPDEFFNPNYHKKYYTTSSKYVNALISQYGLDQFEFEIRKTFKDKISCLKWESKILKHFKVESNPKFLNGDSKQESFKAIQNNVPTKFISNRELAICIRMHKDKPVPDGWLVGNINQNNSHSKNKKWIYNKNTGRNKMVGKDFVLQGEWTGGRPPETSEKQRQSLKSKKFKHYTNGFNDLLLKENEIIPYGYYPGRTYINKPSGKRSFDYVWITNGTENKQIPKQTHLPEGFYFGRHSSHLVGSKNPSAKNVEFKGVVYNTVKDCIESTNLSRYILLKEGLKYL
jgi:hypothetical protein